MRFRLLELLAVVFVCGFATAALVRPNPLLASLAFSFTLCMLLAAILCVVARQGEARFFWIGFVIGGSAYLSWMHEPESSGFFKNDESLATSRVLDWSFRRIHGEPPVTRGMGGGMFSVASGTQEQPSGGVSTNAGGIGGAVLARPPAPADVYWEAHSGFMLSGHCFFTLLFAWIAGHFCRFVRERAP